MDIRREIHRNVILCQSLEPLGKKPGVTNRIEDASPATKLEYFIISSVNSSWAFYDLVDRILREGKQPDCIFDTAFEAQAASVRNRQGSKVNYGQILMLVPLVAAQTLIHLEEEDCGDDIGTMLERTGQVLRNTTEKDVESLKKFIDLGHEISARHHMRLGRPKPPREPYFKKEYSTAWESFNDFLHLHMVREMAEGYPQSERVYRFLLHNVEDGILPASDLIYNLLLPEIGRADATADMIACGLYLALTAHPETTLFC